MRYRVVAHDPEWKQRFDAEAERIRAVLGHTVVALHHIGSTAIPGISAKPIIDGLLEVNDLSALDDQASAMEELGYEVMGEFGIPGRRYFRKDDAHGDRTHQLHAFVIGSADIVRHLAFRDYLIANPEQAQAYSALKENLAAKHPQDFEAYIQGKDAFVKDREAKALAWWSEQKNDASNA
jgi:GrpB-like predicted nucleotidyltransferase (UPF0157 family)